MKPIIIKKIYLIRKIITCLEQLCTSMLKSIKKQSQITSKLRKYNAFKQTFE